MWFPNQAFFLYKRTDCCYITREKLAETMPNIFVKWLNEAYH